VVLEATPQRFCLLARGVWKMSLQCVHRSAPIGKVRFIFNLCLFFSAVKRDSR
jgi:hypothetical protein